MPAIRGASSVVIRCFKRLEHAADAITGAAGPVFIAMAWILTGTIGFAFFDVVARDLSWTITLLLLPLYILVPGNMYVQYWLVTHIPPGTPSRDERRWTSPVPQRRLYAFLAPERWGFRRASPDPFPLQPPQRVRRCAKCDAPKPVRSHHCSVCNRCVLLMDHHCPWINACVGLHNQRHFVLFMLWLALGAGIFSVLGWPHFVRSLDFYKPWDAYLPKVVFTLAWILAVACGSAVLVLAVWHLYMVSRGETSIESHDNNFLEQRAKSEGLIYLNPFDLGRRRNLENFFNIAPGGYPRITLLFPLVVPPFTDGWVYPRRTMPTLPDDAAPLLQHAEDRTPVQRPGQHLEAVHEERMVGDGPGGRFVMGGGDELTDDEGGGGGWWDEERSSPDPGR